MSTFEKNKFFAKLPAAEQQFLDQLVARYPFTFQQQQMLVEYSVDLYCWRQGSLSQFHQPKKLGKAAGKTLATNAFNQFRRGYEQLKSGEKKYSSFEKFSAAEQKFPDEQMVEVKLRGSIMGECPVASEKTRCCNLKTLDAVQQCGFDCSYCSIQSFYHGNQVRFIENLVEHLQSLELDPKKTYHIGTGQSSDSLMWGNRFGLLESLYAFARKNPNVILEMKSKSGRIDYFLKNHPPKNMVFTWSLNTPTVIEHEEKATASLEKRLASARALADRGIAIGFHLHPITWYQGWQDDYCDLVSQLVKKFRPEEVVMTSLGTLTFIKPVLKKIRERMLTSSILQMPMEEIAGKLSYPFAIKKEMFSTIYRAFPVEWHDSVFFYMCMEHIDLWQPVFGREYASNEDFEEDMLKNYSEKLMQISNRKM